MLDHHHTDPRPATSEHQIVHLVPEDEGAHRSDGAPPITLLIWDIPNMDQETSRLTGWKPSNRQRPNPAALASWLRADTHPGTAIEAIAFMNVLDDADLSRKRAWGINLNKLGYSVRLRPKRRPTDDVDAAMVAAIEERRHRVGRLVLLSHDRACFSALTADLVADGLEVNPVILTGMAQWPAGVRPIDLYTLPGVVREQLPRLLSFADMPEEGVLMPPTGPFGAPPAPVAARGQAIEPPEEAADVELPEAS